MKILFIDDDEFYVGLFIDMLDDGCKELGWNITHVDNFPEAKKIARSDLVSFDAVFSDTELGGGFKGYDLLPYFIDKGYFSILMSGNDYSKEAERIGCLFLDKNNTSEMVSTIKVLHKDIIEFKEKNY